MAVGAVASVAVGPFVWGPRFEHLATPFKIAMAATVISVPVTAVLLLFFSGSPWRITTSVMQFGYVLVISLIVTTAAYVRDAMMKKDEAPATMADPIEVFLERLPVKYRTAKLHAISSEDHYLRVHTSLGEELILMRLADAVRELAGADGLQVHRSWWDAKTWITDEKRVDGRSLLVLESGVEVPVSRSYRSSAKAAGLIR